LFKPAQRPCHIADFYGGPSTASGRSAERDRALDANNLKIIKQAAFDLVWARALAIAT